MTEIVMITGTLNKAKDSESFEDKVNTKLAEGWELRGPVTYDPGNFLYVQMMAREIEVKSNGRKIDTDRL